MEFKNILTVDTINDMRTELLEELSGVSRKSETGMNLLENIDELQELLNEMPEGASLVKESYFFNGFAEDEANSIYDTVKGWPFDCIDWDKAARELAMDYRHVQVLGVEYMTRHF